MSGTYTTKPSSMTPSDMTSPTGGPPPYCQELLAVAKRVVWFKPAAATLADDVFFLNFLMVYGTVEDIIVARQWYDDDDFREALRNALPGIFGARSWAYWHARLDMGPAPAATSPEVPALSARRRRSTLPTRLTPGVSRG